MARSAPPGTTLLCMLPDTGERYLSTPLFEGLSAEMSDEELAISRSTASGQLDAPAPSPAAAALQLRSAEGEEFVHEVLHDATRPVVMFAFEWCEFCWSVRKLFEQCKIPYRSIDIDSVEFQQDNRGGKIRTALGALTGSPTIPQILIGGNFVGGATEVFDAFQQGRLQQLLSEHGVPFDRSVTIDPYSLLPNWLEQNARRRSSCAIPPR